MSFREELEARIRRYKTEVENLRASLEHKQSLLRAAEALLHEEEWSGPQLPLPSNNGHQGEAITPTEAGSASMTTGEAIDVILEAGHAMRFLDIKNRVASDFPSIHVKDVPHSVFSALRYGVKVGKYVKVKKGVYRKA